jgi:polyisoprenoid-binding protein YceI
VKSDWLHAAKFPQASLDSVAIQAVGPGRYELAGQLSIKGTARAVRIPVALARSGAMTIATGAFTVKRLEFKVGDGDWSDTSLVANEVQVNFKLALSGMAAL